MLLKSIQVVSYKSIADSGLVTINQNVTCLVGKNESGKTAFLEALYRLNPLPAMGHAETFDGLRDYPRRLHSRDKERVPETEVIKSTFILDDEDVAAVEKVLVKGVLSGKEVTITRNYKNEQLWNIPLDEEKLINQLVADAGLDAGMASGIDTVAGLREKLSVLPDPPAAVTDFLSGLKNYDPDQMAIDVLSSQLPKFLYFDNYSIMPGKVSIHRLQTQEKDLTAGERTSLSLIRLSGIEPADLTEANYEARKAALEAAANQLTDEVFEFWSQNRDLLIELDVDFKSPPDPKCGNPPYLQVRVFNRRHRVSLNLGERSHGFMWFFSFLAAFSEFRDKQKLVLLLDEPGLMLHAAAQDDLLRFIDERLAIKHQVIYTTHSPFMVKANRLERVRTVEDADEVGTKVSADVLSTSKDTRFPLQAALGYDLAQTLFLGPDNLVVEGPADMLYLQIMGEHLRSLGRANIDPRWAIVPVGGLDKIPTFVALLGSQLNVAVILDVASGGSQKVASLVQRGIIAGEKIINLTEFTRTNEADIEDLFEPSFYVNLLKRSSTVPADFSLARGSGRILRRIEVGLGSAFSHLQPARYLLDHQTELLGGIGGATLDRFEGLIGKVNSLLG